MQHSLPPLSALRVLEALWRTGSATAAAEDLRVSHSAISHHIANLEQMADVALIRREGRRSVLTPAGQSLGKVLNESFIAIGHELDLLALRERGPVMIAASPMVISGWLLPRLEAFRRRRPETVVHFSPIMNDTPLPDGIDIAIRFARYGNVPAGGHPLFSGRAIPVATPDFLRRHPVHSAEDIARLPAVHDEDSRMWRLWFERAGVLPQHAAAPRTFASQGSLALELVLSGSLAALCREETVRNRMERGEVVALSDIGIDDETCYYLQSSSKQLSRCAEELTGYLLADAPLAGRKPPPVAGD